MDEADRDRIISNRNHLLQCIRFQDVIPFLTQKNILTETQVEAIQTFSSNEEQVQALLIELVQSRTTATAFEQFIECLIETNHLQAVNLIRPGIDVTAFGSNSAPPQSISNQPRLLVKKAERIRRGSDCYKMTCRPRGLWILINNYKFERGYDDRKGSEQDAKRMEEVAADLGFEVRPETNKTAGEMYELLEKLSQDPRLSEHDALFVQIMSHGDQDVIAGTDGHVLHVHDIKSFFNSENCPSLISKPKVFIFVACRGAKYDGPITRSKSLTDQPNFFASSFEKKCSLTASTGDVDGKGRELARSRRPSGRLVDDTLTAYSTVPGFVSHRHPEDGTYYIAILAQTLMEQSCTDHLVKMLNKVDQEFKEHVVINDEYMQTPGFEHTGFTKKVRTLQIIVRSTNYLLLT